MIFHRRTPLFLPRADISRAAAGGSMMNFFISVRACLSKYCNIIKFPRACFSASLFQRPCKLFKNKSRRVGNPNLRLVIKLVCGYFEIYRLYVSQLEAGSSYQLMPSSLQRSSLICKTSLLTVISCTYIEKFVLSLL